MWCKQMKSARNADTHLYGLNSTLAFAWQQLACSIQDGIAKNLEVTEAPSVKGLKVGGLSTG